MPSKPEIPKIPQSIFAFVGENAGDDGPLSIRVRSVRLWCVFETCEVVGPKPTRCEGRSPNVSGDTFQREYEFVNSEIHVDFVRDYWAWLPSRRRVPDGRVGMAKFCGADLSARATRLGMAAEFVCYPGPV